MLVQIGDLMPVDKFEVKGLDKLLKRIEETDPKKKVAVLRKAARKAMLPVKNDMISGANIDEGDLRASIDMRARTGSRRSRKRLLTIAVGPVKKRGSGKAGKTFNRINAKAIAQEYGTARQAAKPFIRPALEKNKRRVLNELKREVKKMWEKGAKK